LRTLIVVLLLCVSTLSAPAAVVQAAGVAVTPAAGSADDTFTIAGEGLSPGMALDIVYQSPGGAVLPATPIGMVVVVNDDGEFTFDITPATDFTEPAVGKWLVQVCVTGTDECAEATFDVQ
jgi:hypothetical protein